MTSQDDLGMVWYGVSGVSFNPTDPAEVMLNTGTAAPLLSDQPRSLLAPEGPHPFQGQNHHQATLSYGDHAIAPQSQMLYDPNTGDFVSQTEYIYESYEGYDEDSCGTNSLGSAVQQQMGPQHETQMQICEEDGGMQTKTKKPKVHQHPSLKLKTPIAYQKDTDLDAIPIMKEGMAVCERCGAIGVKHAFYGKERKFCSLVCARGGANISTTPKNMPIESHNENEEHNHMEEENVKTESNENSEFVFSMPVPVATAASNCEELKKGKRTTEVKNETPQAESSPEITANSLHVSIPRADPSYLPPVQNDYWSSQNSDSFDWASNYLLSESFVAAPVQIFKHAPMSEGWEHIAPGMKVEVSCRDDSLLDDAFWVATVINIAGYKAKLRYEGFVDDTSHDFWIDICSNEVHPVGWCATQGQALIPPKSIQFKYKDWKEFLMKRLTGARTLPINFGARVIESQKSRFRPGLNLEVVDKNRIAQMRVATVTAVIGKRLHLRYHGASTDDNGFWCHEDSAIIHPVGWSREVGHEIVASQSYHEKCMQVSYDPEDAAPDLFLSPSITEINSKLHFKEGMKLEAIDPLNLSTICVATIMRVLAHNYLMIRIDSYDNDNTGSDWFCYHSSSRYIFPAGFCELDSIVLTPPRGYKGDFSWETYLLNTQSAVASSLLFNRSGVENMFSAGMYLEAADLMDPRLVCVAMVKETQGTLLKIHFDGWESEFDQWIDCQSCDIYPVGWCAHVDYKLEGPKEEDPRQSIPRRKIKIRGGKKGRPFGRRGGLSRGIENDSPIPYSNYIHTGTSKRWRNSRGSRTANHRPLQSQDIINDGTTDSPLECQTENKTVFRAKRGRPRKTPLGTLNQALKSGPRPIRTTRASLSYHHSDDEEGSDETSSGVASLAESEASADFWDDDGISQVNSPNILNPDQFSHNKEQELQSHLTTIPDDTAYRDNSQADLGNVLLEEDKEPRQVKEEGTSLCGSPLSTISEYQVTSSGGFIDGDASELSDAFSNIIPSECVKSEGLLVTGIGLTTLNSVPLLSENSCALSTTPFHSLSNHTSSVASQSDPMPFSDEVETNNDLQPYIPRIIDSTVDVKGSNILPKTWLAEDVCVFLTKNDCGAYCENFILQNITGSKLLALQQNDLMSLTRMKVGPSLKIEALIQQLLAIINPAQARYQATLLKRGRPFNKS